MTSENSLFHDHPHYRHAAEVSPLMARILPILAARNCLLDPDRALTEEVIAAHMATHWPDLSAHVAVPIEEAAQGLRQFRNSIMAGIIARDLSGAADLDENLLSISSLASFVVNTAYSIAARGLAERYGAPVDEKGRPIDLMVVGMGKLGGHELNASSDIDLIYLVAEAGQTTGLTDGSGVIDSFSFFERCSRRISQLLSEPTADGFVFRIDLRLRPNGESGPIICSLPMLEEYLMVQGREWERYAWIKARVINSAVLSDPTDFERHCQALEEIRRPFVYRRYLDYNALGALRELHGQIREEADRRSGHRESRMAGDHETIDVKLGRGGIREIEFIAQLFQLIRGGKDASLRSPSTRETLKVLEKQGRLSPEETSLLLEAYRFWRRIEHRLQYKEDAQTHVLPGTASAYDYMVLASGLRDIQTLINEIERHRQVVSELFDRLFRRDESNEVAEQDTGEEDRGRPRDREGRLARLHERIRLRAESAVNPELVEGRLRGLLDAISRRDSYLALLDEYPEALTRVARVAEASAWASDYLRRHPIVLDELLDHRTLMDPPDLALFSANLQADIAQAVQNDEPDIERQMDALREAHHAQLFRLLVQDLEGRWSVEHLSDQLSALADRIIAATLDAAWRATPKRHRETPKFAVIAYGKLGGKELGYASDLDLIFIHDDEDERAQERYARLAQRINVWLSTTTSAGSLFEIDLRLRPNGNAGLLVTDLQGFIDYQENRAWVWEHQALTRARFCAGDASIGQAFEAERHRILRLQRDRVALLEEILAMREKMHEGHPNPSELFDLKHDPGGMVDIEFMVQALVLGNAHQFPELSQNLGNIALLGMAAQRDLIPQPLAEATADAYRVFRQHQHRIRLSGAASARIAPEDLASERGAVRQLWTSVFQDAPSTIRPLSEIRLRTG